MSDFRAKYHALHILQKLASGDASQSRGGRGNASASPRKPGIRSSDDILQEKYAELAELMAVQHLEKRAVSALQKMYLSPKKSERKPRRSRRRKDDGRSREGDRCKSRIDNYESVDKDMMKPRPPSAKKLSRPQSASSNSSLSSHASAKSTSSRSSNLSNASRLSSASNNSRASSRSSASSTSSKASARSNSSRSSTRSSTSSKPVERHIVTIVEEEEEEEVVNQDKIEERGVVRFDEDLAKENEEEARLKKEATKRTRRVSFVLEAEAESSSEEDEDDGNASSDDTLKDDECVEPGGEDNFPSNHKSDDYDDVELEEEKHDSFYQKNRHGDVPRTKYIEIENSILREILSPRSPRRMPKHSPRSDEHSPTRRTRSKSPRRTRRNTSPMRAWETSSSLPLPERPKRDISPCDHKLSSTDNPDVKRWLRHKNALKRRQRKEELKKERDERMAADAVERQKQNKHEESEHLYGTWLQEKEKVLRKQHKMDKLSAKEEKKREDEERAKREEMLMEKRRAAASAFGEKLPTPRPEKKRRRKRKQKKGELGTDGSNKTEKEISGDKTFPSSNPFKGLTYDQWMRQKLDKEQTRKKEVKSKKKSDPELEEVIPNIAKERIQRATGGKGKRVDSGLRAQTGHENTHKSDPQEEKTDHSRPYKWQQSAEAPNLATGERSSNQKQRAQDPKRVSLQRPSTGQNRLSKSQEGVDAHTSATLGRKQHRQPHRGFSPSSARPEPQGSESNDDHSERSAKLGNLNKNRPASEDRNNNDSHDNGPVSKAVVKQEKTGDENSIILDPDDLSVFMTEAMS